MDCDMIDAFFASQPFENKWSRTASTPTGGGATSQQSGKQTQPADHK